MKGLFISFEGIEGSGKSTQINLICRDLQSKGYGVVRTEEPGGAPISLRIRELLLSPESRGMDPITELLLYNAARVQHIKEVIGPALQRGEIVVTDRFSDSTTAYQGFGRGIDLKLIDALDAIATGGLKPDLTILLDMDVRTGLSRNRLANKKDRLEMEEVAFHEKVRKGFLHIAEREPERVRKVDCSGDIRAVHDEIAEIITAFVQERKGRPAG